MSAGPWPEREELPRQHSEAERNASDEQGAPSSGGRDGRRGDLNRYPHRAPKFYVSTSEDSDISGLQYSTVTGLIYPV